MQNVGLFDPLSPHHGLLEAQKTSLRPSRPCETEVTQETHSGDAQGQPPINLNLGSSKLGGAWETHICEHHLAGGFGERYSPESTLSTPCAYYLRSKLGDYRGGDMAEAEGWRVPLDDDAP